MSKRTFVMVAQDAQEIAKELFADLRFEMNFVVPESMQHNFIMLPEDSCERCDRAIPRAGADYLCAPCRAEHPTA